MTDSFLPTELGGTLERLDATPPPEQWVPTGAVLVNHPHTLLALTCAEVFRQMAHRAWRPAIVSALTLSACRPCLDLAQTVGRHPDYRCFRPSGTSRKRREIYSARSAAIGSTRAARRAGR
jgi:hypothetical protein